MPLQNKNKLETGGRQADPVLRISEGHANPVQIGFATAAIIVVVSLLFYGLNHPRTEQEEINARAPVAPATETTAVRPAPAPAQSQQNLGQPQQSGQQQTPAQRQGARQGNPPATTGQGDQKR